VRRRARSIARIERTLTENADMLAMQYGFDFDEAFDMDSIRVRVGAIGSHFNSVPGLYYKAFLITEHPCDGGNRYAPFYVWRDGTAMTDFLLSDAFGAVQQKFGRPAVQRWEAIGLVSGPAANDVPRLATRETMAIAPDVDLAVAAAASRAASRNLSSAPGLHSQFVGLDTESWQWLRFSLWCTPPPPTLGGERFEVLYLAMPAGAAS
jgi:hypothetical protein